jgi:hypothetical protein
MTKKSLLDDILVDNKGSSINEENQILQPLLDEINLIIDEGVRSFVRSVLLKADLFWIIPSAFASNHHPKDEHNQGGNVLHTKRVARIADTISGSYSLSSDERDLVIAAALIHDVTKGIPTEDNVSFQFDPMHAYTVNSFVIECQKYDKEFGNDGLSSSLFITEDAMQTILRLVRCHLGPWSPVPETFPITYLDYILHVADNIAANLHNFTGLSIDG